MTISRFRLDGKKAIVSGGKSGIGRAIALAFAEAGADIAICGRTIADGKLQSVADEIQSLGQRSLAIQADISRQSDVDSLMRKAMDEFGTIDILINNAGIIHRIPLMDTSEEQWDQVIDINLKGYFLCAQAAAKIMMTQKGGNIINMSSALGTYALKNTGAYCISKAGVIMLSRMLAVELGGYNIRVNTVCPGMIKTDINKSIWTDSEMVKQKARATSLGRIGEPDDVIGATLFLASDASGYTTGESVLVDGGKYP
jgi:NAD(P)-dependent dehydrogenase (short-subunit alcohol dehydrogenase family)